MSVLFIGSNGGLHLNQPIHFAQISDAEIKPANYKVVILSPRSTDFSDLKQKLLAFEKGDLFPTGPCVILLKNDLNMAVVQDFIQTFRPFRIAADCNDPRLESFVDEALQASEPVETNLTTRRLTALLRTFNVIFHAQSIAELESLLLDALQDELRIEWVRIRYKSQSTPTLNNLGVISCAVELTRDGNEAGQVVFGRSKNPFDREEKKVLRQIGSILSLIITRLERWFDLERARIGWEATFDSIREPLCIIGEDRTLIRVNQEFARAAGIAIEKIAGKKCFSVLFGRLAPCETCSLGRQFHLGEMKSSSGDEAVYDVFSHASGESSLLTKDSGIPIYLNLYRDVSAKLRAEHKLIESAKLAELGTISSSIAHELNNPLGGMLAFTQLIQSELAKNRQFPALLSEDINEIEQSIRRCSEIVKSLLIYVRKSSNPSESVDVREAIRQAIQIVSLQTKALGIPIQTKIESAEDGDFMIYGNFNLIVQLMCLILQQTNLALQKRRSLQQTTQGLQARVIIQSERQHVNVLVSDSGHYDEKTPLASPIIEQIAEGVKASLKANYSGGRNLQISFLKSSHHETAATLDQ